MNNKKCAKCGIDKPLSEFHKHKASKDGVRGQCKQCRVIKREYYKPNVLVCTKCKKEKTVSEFCKKTHNRSGFRSECKECEKSYRETRKEIKKQYDENYRAQNWEKRAKSQKQYRLKNKDRIRVVIKSWHDRNPNCRVVSSQNRRARKNNAEGKITKEVVNKLLLSQAAWCYYCQCDISNSFHIEHKTPLSKGGTNLHDNLCLSCKKCNLEKGTKTEQEYLDWRIIIEQSQ